MAFNFLLDTFWNDVYGFQLKRTEMKMMPKILPFKHFLGLSIRYTPTMMIINLKHG